MRSEMLVGRRHYHAGEGILVAMRKLFRETKVALVPDDDELPRWFVDELEVLGLAGREFSPEEYVRRLAQYLGIKILVLTLADEEYPDFREEMFRRGHYALVVRDEASGDARILVPESLGEIRRHQAIYHECGHIAPGHRIPRPGLPDPDPERPGHWYDPVAAGHAKLALAAPPHDPDECEAEARLRARLTLRAGLYGEQLFDEDEEFFGRPR